VETAQIRPGDPLLFKAVRIIREHVEYLQQRGAVRYIDSAVFTFGEPRELLYLPKIQVANWIGKPCGASDQPSTQPPTSPPPENSTPTADGMQRTAEKQQAPLQKTAVGVADGGRKKRTLVDFL